MEVLPRFVEAAKVRELRTIPEVRKHTCLATVFGLGVLVESLRHRRPSSSTQQTFWAQCRVFFMIPYRPTGFPVPPLARAGGKPRMQVVWKSTKPAVAIARRCFAQQVIFDRSAKRAQKSRAANMLDRTEYTYLHDEIAARLLDRVNVRVRS